MPWDSSPLGGYIKIQAIVILFKDKLCLSCENKSWGFFVLVFFMVCADSYLLTLAQLPCKSSPLYMLPFLLSSDRHYVEFSTTSPVALSSSNLDLGS